MRIDWGRQAVIRKVVQTHRMDGIDAQANDLVLPARFSVTKAVGRDFWPPEYFTKPPTAVRITSGSPM